MRIPTYLARETPAAAPPAPIQTSGLQDVGQSLDRLGATLERRHLQEEQLLEAQQKRQGDLWLTRSLAELRSGTATGFLEAQNKAPADGAGFMQSRLEDYETRYRDTLDAAPTPEAAEEFQIRALGVRDDLVANATAFEAKLHGEAVRSTFTASLGQYAATVRADPMQFGGSLEEASAAIERLDLPADQRAALMSDTRETLGLSYFNGLIDADPGAARSALLAGGADALTLSPETRERMLGAADVEIRRRDAEARAAAAETRQLFAFQARNRIEDEMAAAQDGGTTGLVTDADWQIAYGAQGWQGAKANVEATRNVAVAATELALTPPSRWGTAIDEAAPSPAGAGYKEEGDRRQAMTGAAQKLLTELEADPAAYVFRHSPELQTAFRDAGSDPAKLPAAMRLSLSLQETMEVPPERRQPLPKDQAVAIVDRWKAAGTIDQKLSELAPLTIGLGDDQVAGAVLRQLEAQGLPAGTDRALERLRDGDIAGARSIIGAVTTDPKDLPQLSTETAQTVTAAIDDVFDRNSPAGVDARVYALTGQPSVGASLVRDRDLIGRITRTYVAAGTSPADAAERAEADVYGAGAGVLREEGLAELRLPPGADGERLVSGLETLRSRLDLAALAPARASFATGPEGDAEYRSATADFELYAADLREGAIWVNLGDRFGLIDPATGLAIAGDDGKPRRWTLEEILGVAAPTGVYRGGTSR